MLNSVVNYFIVQRVDNGFDKIIDNIRNKNDINNNDNLNRNFNDTNNNEFFDSFEKTASNNKKFLRLVLILV